MTPHRCETYLALVALAADALDRDDVPADLRDRASRILKLAPVELPYLPPALPVSQFAEPVHETDA